MTKIQDTCFALLIHWINSCAQHCLCKMSCNLTCAEYESESTCSSLGFLQHAKTMQKHGRSAVWKATGLREAPSAICTFRSISLPGHLIPRSIRGSWQLRAAQSRAGRARGWRGWAARAAVPLGLPDVRVWAAGRCWRAPGPNRSPPTPVPSAPPRSTALGHTGAWETSQGRFALWKGNEWFLPGSCSLYVFWPVRSCFRTSVPFLVWFFFFSPA